MERSYLSNQKQEMKFSDNQELFNKVSLLLQDIRQLRFSVEYLFSGIPEYDDIISIAETSSALLVSLPSKRKSEITSIKAFMCQIISEMDRARKETKEYKHISKKTIKCLRRVVSIIDYFMMEKDGKDHP